MSLAEVRSNILTFLSAGHETTANTLVWAVFLLSQGRNSALSLLVQRFDMQLIPGAKGWPLQKITLRPAYGLPMRVATRSRG
jgi:cytochrome P450